MNNTYKYRHTNNSRISVQTHVCLYCGHMCQQNTCTYDSEGQYEHMCTCSLVAGSPMERAPCAGGGPSLGAACIEINGLEDAVKLAVCLFVKFDSQK